MEIKHNKIYPLDCLKGMEYVREQSVNVDVIVTSPPYNLGKDYNSYHDNKPREVYMHWMEDVACKCKEVMNDGASFFLNVGGKPTDRWIPLDIAQRFRKHFVLQNVIHWIKSISIPQDDVGDYPAINGDISVGHYQPVNSDRFFNSCHEYIFHFTKKGDVQLDKLSIGVPYQDKSNIGRWKSADEDVRDRGNTWFIPYKTIRRARPHPTVFPVKLSEMCLKVHGVAKTDLVLDPFMGIGSTAVACKKLGLDYIGFEIDEVYVQIANERLSQTKLIEAV